MTENLVGVDPFLSSVLQRCPKKLAFVWGRKWKWFTGLSNFYWGERVFVCQYVIVHLVSKNDKAGTVLKVLFRTNYVWMWETQAIIMSLHVFKFLMKVFRIHIWSKLWEYTSNKKLYFPNATDRTNLYSFSLSVQKHCASYTKATLVNWRAGFAIGKAWKNKWWNSVTDAKPHSGRRKLHPYSSPDYIVHTTVPTQSCFDIWGNT